MLKTNKKTLIISSLIILLPIAAGLLLWNRLPDRMSTHWGFDGQADSWSGKAFAVFASPLSILLCHWLCILATAADPKNKAQNRKATGMVLWICPLTSLFSSATIYGIALRMEWNMASITFVLVGLMFAGIGNYLPKVKPNFTIGIKTVWALHNEENWNATHRFSGKLWVTGGIAMAVLSFLPLELTVIPMVLVIMVLALGSVFYSWLYYKKQIKAGSVTPSPQRSKEQKTTAAITKGTLIFTAVVLVLVGILLFSGHIDVTYSSDSFTMDASFWKELTVKYEDIESLEYRDGDVAGTRTWGFGTFRLLLGTFENEEFGYHTRYTYYDPEACIILRVKENALVISGRDAEETRSIHDQLIARLEG